MSSPHVPDGPGYDTGQADEHDEAGHDADETEGTWREAVRDQGEDRDGKDSSDGREGNGLSHGVRNPGGKLRWSAYTRVKVRRKVDLPRPALPTGGVHVGAFGYSNPEWLLWPLGTFRVETLVLLEMPGHDRARARLREKHIDIDAELAKVVKTVERIEVDLWSPGDVGRTLLDVSKAHGPLRANISTGPNPWCVAANLAASFAEITVYHVTRDGKSLVHIPTIRSKAPTSREMKLLQALPMDGSEISGSLLKTRLRNKDFFAKSTSTKPAKIREQGQVNTVVPRLEEWGALVKGKHGARTWYRLGPSGECLLKMFGP